MSFKVKWIHQYVDEIVIEYENKIKQLQKQLDEQTGKIEPYPNITYRLGKWHDTELKKQFDSMGYEKLKGLLQEQYVSDKEDFSKLMEVFNQRTGVINNLINICTNVGLKKTEKYQKSSKSSKWHEKETDWAIGLKNQIGSRPYANIDDWFRNLNAKIDKWERERIQKDNAESELKKLQDEAQSLGFKESHLILDTYNLMMIIETKKREWLEYQENNAPYYILASYYSHCLRGDWSSGTRSYGCRELQNLDIPEEDSERPEIHGLVKELSELAHEWDGMDGRDFRRTYSELDELLSEEEARILEQMDSYHFNLNY
jgi:uncharacterized protein (UPF0335 family)